jgi:hypothetical protein
MRAPACATGLHASVRTMARRVEPMRHHFTGNLQMITGIKRSALAVEYGRYRFTDAFDAKANVGAVSVGLTFGF